MTDKWQDISTDDILNYLGGGTGVSSRYERILRHKSIESTDELAQQVNGLTVTAYRASQGMKEKVDMLLDQNEQTATAQKRQSWVTLALTIVIAVSTVIYTIITWQSVSEMRKANRIQEQLIQFESERIEETNGNE